MRGLAVVTAVVVGSAPLLLVAPVEATCGDPGQMTTDCLVNVSTFLGVTVEAGAGTGAAGGQGVGEAYVVAEFGPANDYVGVSNYENGNEGYVCQRPAAPGGNEGATGTNSGGCYGDQSTWIDLRGGPLLVVFGSVLVGTGIDVADLVPLPVAKVGGGTGPFDNSSRDGARL